MKSFKNLTFGSQQPATPKTVLIYNVLLQFKNSCYFLLFLFLLIIITISKILLSPFLKKFSSQQIFYDFFIIVPWIIKLYICFDCCQILFRPAG